MTPFMRIAPGGVVEEIQASSRRKRRTAGELRANGLIDAALVLERIADEEEAVISPFASSPSHVASN